MFKSSWPAFFLAFLCWGIFLENHLYSQIVQNDKRGPIHEAFVARITENIPLEAIPMKPLPEINERAPKQLDMQSEWITGYWSWDSQLDAFIWISGVWRRPPPGHQWVTGFWMESSGGWIWVPGYWNHVSSYYADYIGVSPPDSIDENPSPPPTNAYFWIPGYWYFLFDKQEYQWIPGSWKELDPNWVFVPAHYVWRSRGYIFVPAYWDWPLEKRGTAYSNIVLESSYRYRMIFEPTSIIKTSDLVKRLFLDYPDYRCFFSHHWSTHPKFWQEFHCAPSWWEWETWWCYTWHDHWSLWWWYTHPGYPQPFWITTELTGIIPSPLRDLLTMFHTFSPPMMITSNGVVKGEDFLLAIRKRSGGGAPILPSNPKLKDKISILAASKITTSAEILKPMRRRLPIDPSARRPHIRKPVVDGGAIASVPKVNSRLRPAIPIKPKIPSHSSQGIWQSQSLSQDSPIYVPPTHRPIWTPKATQPSKSLDKSRISFSKKENDSYPLIASQIKRPHIHWIETKETHIPKLPPFPCPAEDKEENY